MNSFPKPSVSVIVVSDYDNDSGEQKSWRDERCMLTALCAQDFEEPFDVILVENESVRKTVPPDLHDIFPNLEICFSQATQSAELKDYGVSLTSTPFVAVFEADCVPNVEWLRVVVEVLRKNPHVSAVSGRTIYGNRSMWQRSFSVLDRGYMDLGRAGLPDKLSNNSVLCRRELLEKYPYPRAMTPFISASLRLRQMRQDGHQFYFDPRARAIHAFGWNLEKDLRRHRGILHMELRARKSAWIIPKLLLKNFWVEFRSCLRLGLDQLRWYDWPATVTLLVLIRFLELPGMIEALHERDHIPNTAYR